MPSPVPSKSGTPSTGPICVRTYRPPGDGPAWYCVRAPITPSNGCACASFKWLQPQCRTDDAGQMLGDGSSLIAGRRFDHDAYERLGARTAKQHATAIAESGRGLRYRLLQGRVAISPGFIDVGHIDQHLRQHRHDARQVSQRTAGRGHPRSHMYGREDAVSRGSEVAHHNVSGLFAAQNITAAAHLAGDMAVADRRPDDFDTGRLQG